MGWTCDEDGRKQSCKETFVPNQKEMGTKREADQS